MHHDCAEREGQRDQIELDEAALLILVVDDVERIEDRLHAGIGAPQRKAEADHERERQLAVAVAGDARDLIADQLVGALPGITLGDESSDARRSCSPSRTARRATPAP